MFPCTVPDFSFPGLAVLEEVLDDEQTDRQTDGQTDGQSTNNADQPTHKCPILIPDLIDKYFNSKAYFVLIAFI